jgi:ferrochelatase
MAETCDYTQQVAEAARLVMERVPPASASSSSGSSGWSWEVVYQSRSGPPQQPWLGPDINDRLAELAGAAAGVGTVVVVPIGFIADHMEVVYDLDVRAGEAARRAGLGFVRVPTVGTDPRFVAMIRDLVVERMDAVEGGGHVDRVALGGLGAWPDDCPPGCCPPPARPD